MKHAISLFMVIPQLPSSQPNSPNLPYDQPPHPLFYKLYVCFSHPPSRANHNPVLPYILAKEVSASWQRRCQGARNQAKIPTPRSGVRESPRRTPRVSRSADRRSSQVARLAQLGAAEALAQRLEVPDTAAECRRPWVVWGGGWGGGEWLGVGGGGLGVGCGVWGWLKSEWRLGVGGLTRRNEC